MLRSFGFCPFTSRHIAWNKSSQGLFQSPVKCSENFDLSCAELGQSDRTTFRRLAGAGVIHPRSKLTSSAVTASSMNTCPSLSSVHRGPVKSAPCIAEPTKSKPPTADDLLGVFMINIGNAGFSGYDSRHPRDRSHHAKR